MHSLLPLLIILTTLALDIYTDLRLWDSNGIRHKRGAYIRLAALVLAAGLDWTTVFLWPLYGCLFDTALNIGRKLPVFYVGETSYLDRLQRRYPWLVAGKWGLGLGGLMTYILL
jgi:hypothetical protein